MAATKYGDGTLYNGGGIYGRISANLAAAQAAFQRETGLVVQVLDEQLNGWDLFHGFQRYPDNGIGHDFYAANNHHIRMTSLDYWSYRGGMSMLKLPNDNIIRCRLGDPDNINDRQIWIQTITDPNVSAQWDAWAVLYSGTWYSATLQSNGSTGYDIYHSNGLLYKNNVLLMDPAAQGFPNSKVLRFNAVANDTNCGWALLIRTNPYDGGRLVEHLWWIGGASWTWEPYNYQWLGADHGGWLTADGKIHRLSGAPFQGIPRDYTHGSAIVSSVSTRDADITAPDRISKPQTIRGVGGGSGKNYVSGGGIVQLSDGYYYMRGFEVHETENYLGYTNLGYGFPTWCRSKDLVHWSEPVVGPAVHDAWGGTNWIERQGYIYWADFQMVWRRPIGTLVNDISNYVPDVQFDLPRDNQAASGSLTVANPNGVNDWLEDLSDRRIVVKPGIKLQDGSYEFIEYDKFFIKQCQAQIKGKAKRIAVTFGNIWDRLDTDLRDVTNFLGQIQWDDWAPGKRNKAFNYYFSGGSATVSGNVLQTSGVCLYTGWKGNNPDIEAHFSGYGTNNPYIIFRYVDAKNYWRMMYNRSAGQVVLQLVEKGVVTTAATVSGLGANRTSVTMRISVCFDLYQWWFNGVDITAPVNTRNRFPADYIRKQGYTGFSSSSGKYSVSGFHLSEFEENIKNENLVRTALALGDFHDVIVGGADSRIFGVSWGPQTDLGTPAAALASALETDKLQLIYRNGMVEVGKFNDQDPVRTIQNELFQSDQVDNTNRRINMAVVDGNDSSWIQVDTLDIKTRNRQITAYTDDPNLLDHDAVVAKAIEVIAQGAKGASPGGSTPLFFDLWRMDAVNWVDNNGNTQIARIEGFSVDISQGEKPHQRQTFDLSQYSQDSDDGLNDTTVDTE